MQKVRRGKWEGCMEATGVSSVFSLLEEASLHLSAHCFSQSKVMLCSHAPLSWVSL